MCIISIVTKTKQNKNLVYNKTNKLSQGLIVLKQLISQNKMSQCQNNNQLNGYKYSFNRNNPYIDRIVEEIPVTQTEDRNIQKNIKTTLFKLKFQQSVKMQNPTTQFANIKQHSNELYANYYSSNYNDINRFLCNKVQESQKNQILVDLYLRKKKFKKTRNIGGKIDKKQKQQKDQHFNQKYTKLSNIAKEVNLSQTKQTEVQDKNQYRKPLRTQRKKPQSSRSKFKNSKQFRSTRNLSENKLHVYLNCSKQDKKFKQYTSGTAPIKKQLSLLKLNSFSCNQEKTNPNRKNSKNSKNSKKPVQLTKTQTTAHNLRAIQQDSMRIKSVKNSQQSLRRNICALKYKSPRLVMTARNTTFQSLKFASKMRLFTQQQQRDIIQQYYQQSKSKQK